jgi:hypothetical protein
MSVVVKGKQYKTKIKNTRLFLDLHGKKITTIAEIDGLSSISGLQVLNLARNNISEINGLEALTDLQKLDLRLNKISEIKNLETLVNLEELCLQGNNISEIKGLANQTKLKKLYLINNPVDKFVAKTFGLGGMLGMVDRPDLVIAYCRKPPASQQAPPPQQPLSHSVIERVQKLLRVASRIRLDMMRDVVRLDPATFSEKIVDWAAEFGFEIDGDYVDVESGDVDRFIAFLQGELGG